MDKTEKIPNYGINLLVLGNGFDLACRERTSIFDFVESVYRDPNNAFSEYRVNFIVWLIRRLGDETDVGESWREFFELNDSELSDWMDFEKIINHLILNDDVFRKIEKIYNSPLLSKQGTDKAVVFSLANYFLNHRQWHKEVFSAGDTYLDFLEKTIKEFEGQLQNYLVRIDYDKVVYAHKELLIKKLRYGYSCTSVMDFNYTNLPYDPLHHPVYYIHGNTGVGCFVGIDPYFNNPGSNELYKSLGQKIRFTKVYKRLKYLNSEGFQQLVLKKSINRITFFGHSLGEQDYSYFQSVFDYINLYDSDVILVFCYTEYEKDAVVREADRQTKRVFKLINRYGETLTNKDHGNNLLNKLLLEGRLVFKELDTDEIFKEEDLQ